MSEETKFLETDLKTSHPNNFTSAHYRGYMAAKSGLNIEASPYEYRKAGWQSWRKGWRCYHKENKK